MGNDQNTTFVRYFSVNNLNKKRNTYFEVWKYIEMM